MNAYLIGADVLAGEFVDAPDEQAVIEDAVQQAARADGIALKPFEEAPAALLPSALPGVSDVAWTKFALAMRTAQLKSKSKSNALGLFEMKPRRLADLGLMTNVAPVNARKTKAMAWQGEWAPPLTEKTFLSSADAQYRVFTESVRRYFDDLVDGTIANPTPLTLSGALAVLHRCGPRGLDKWTEGDRFEETVELVNRVNGIF